MSTTDGTLINQQLAETRANIELATAQKRQLATDLIERGATNISTDSTIAAIDESACTLIDNLERGALTTAIRFHVNPVGAGGYIPPASILADALDGAHILVEESGTSNVWRIPIASMEDTTVVFDNTFTKAKTTIVASVVLGVSGADIRSKRVAAIVTNSASVDVTVTTYLSDENTFEVGRVFPIAENDATSYLITATTAGGVRTESFGQFDASGVWVSNTGLTAAVPEIDPESGEVSGWANGSENGDSFSAIWPWSAVKRETFTGVDSAGTELELVMSGFRRDAFYGIKVEERDVVFSTLNSDGTTTSVTKPCRILWIARPHLPGYEIPSFFYKHKWEDNGAGGLAMTSELSNGLFLGAHKGNLKTLNLGGTSTSVLTTGTIGSTNTGVSVANFVAYAQNLNKLATLRDPNGNVFGPDTTNRRWAASNLATYMAFWHLFIVQFGVDAQNVFQGIVTDSGGVAQSKAGVTDAVIAAGHMTGSVGPASGYSPFVFLGIENFGYGSEGTGLSDICYYSGRETDDDALETRIMVQPDRSRFAPNTADMTAATAAGYLLLTTRDSTNTVAHLCGRSDTPCLRDLHMPTKADDGFISAKKCDTTHGLYRTGQGTGSWVLSNASIFGHRHASSCGGVRAGVCAFGWVSSSHAPGHAYAAYFGSRVSLLLD